MAEHKQGCPALGGYGRGVEPCLCGAEGLNGCPFCGGKAVLHSVADRDDDALVECSNVSGTLHFPYQGAGGRL